MAAVKFMQWAMGLILGFYVFKGLLGKFQDGDFSKAGIVAIIWFGLVVFTSGIIKIE